MFAVVALGIAIVPLIFGLLLGIALGAPGQPAASYAAAPPAVSSASPAPAPSASAQESPSETHVDEIVRELQALKTLSRWQIAVIGFAAVVIAVLIALLLLRYARIADKMKFGFGFLEFEVKDAVREATERAEDAEALVQKSARTLNTIYTMVHTLQMVGSSDEPVTFNAFLKQCAEEAAAHVDVRISGTVRASVWLADDAQAELRIVAGYRVTSPTMRSFKLSDKRPGFAWEVFKTARWSIKNAKDDPDAITRDPDSRYEIAWILGVPIWADEAKRTPVGVLCVSHDHEEEPLAKTEATICSFYADLASTAVRLAQLRKVALG